jgi:hypothetical protein
MPAIVPPTDGFGPVLTTGPGWQFIVASATNTSGMCRSLMMPLD